MINALIFSGFLSICPQTMVINDTNVWTSIDQMQLSFSKERCIKIYKLDAPCLISFRKVEFQTYRGVCGK